MGLSAFLPNLFSSNLSSCQICVLVKSEFMPNLDTGILRVFPNVHTPTHAHTCTVDLHMHMHTCMHILTYTHLHACMHAHEYMHTTHANQNPQTHANIHVVRGIQKPCRCALADQRRNQQTRGAFPALPHTLSADGHCLIPTPWCGAQLRLVHSHMERAGAVQQQTPALQPDTHAINHQNTCCTHPPGMLALLVY